MTTNSCPRTPLQLRELIGFHEGGDRRIPRNTCIPAGRYRAGRCRRWTSAAFHGAVCDPYKRSSGRPGKTWPSLEGSVAHADTAEGLTFLVAQSRTIKRYSVPVWSSGCTETYRRWAGPIQGNARCPSRPCQPFGDAASIVRAATNPDIPFAVRLKDNALRWTDQIGNRLHPPNVSRRAIAFWPDSS